MKTIEQQLSDAGVVYKIYPQGILIEHNGKVIHMSMVESNHLNRIYAKSIQLGLIPKPETITIIAYSQSIWETIHSQESAYKLLSDMGFVIISHEYNSIADASRIEVLPCSIRLPEWAEIAKS